MPSMLSNVGLSLARMLPRGGFQLVRSLAHRDPSLHALPVALTMLSGKAIRADLRESVWYPLWRFGHYPHQLAEDRFAWHLLRPSDTVWDIGANIGYTAVLFAERVGRTGKVLAVEPGRRAFPMLESSVQGQVNVQCVRAAVSDQEGTVTFADNEHLDESRVSSANSSGYSVSCTTLDRLLERGGPPTFLKIDVEGHELPAFRGAKSLFERHTPIMEFEALTPEAFRENTALLTELTGGRYRYRRFAHDGRLTDAVPGPIEGFTNNYLALTESLLPRVEEAAQAALKAAQG